MSEDSSLTTHSSSSNYSDAAERSPVRNNEINVSDMREELLSLLNKSPEEGETWCLISRNYLDNILKSSVESFEESHQQVDTLNVIEDAHEDSPFYKDSNEANVSVYIPSEAFKKLEELFDVRKKNTERAIFKDPVTGVAYVEKYSPYFYVHTLNKSISHGDRKSKGFFMSSTKTFNDLRFAVHDELSRDPTKNRTRLWFISSDNANDLEANVPISTFISNIPKRHLISPLYYGCTLKSQSIDKFMYHVLLEFFDESKGSYPVDSYLETFDISKYDVERRAEAGGQLGLANLGNTCYMNSALQCVLHIPEIDQYFYYNLYEKELNTNNPIGYNGHVAIAFGSLLHKMFNQKNFGAGYVSPRDFKYTVGHYSSMFRGFQQQDSQEFLSWLLDALHEDLNRIQQKPYCEKPELRDDEEDLDSAVARLAEISWSQHKKRNDSVIVDLFTGLYESTLICPDCSKTSITFDPFNDITLPLPVNKKWYHTFNIVNLGKRMDNIEEPIMKLEVELDKTSNFDDLLKYLSNFLKVPQDYLFLFEIFNNFFFKDFRAKYDRIKFFPNSDIIYDGDDIYVYIIPHNRETDVIVPVIFTSPEEDASYRMTNPIGIPIFTVLERESETKDYRRIQGNLDSLFLLLSGKFQDQQPNEDVDMAEPGSDNESYKNEESGYPQCEEIYSFSADSRLGYRIKVYRESNVSSRHSSDRKRVYSEEAQKSILSIPSFRPNFNNLPLLFEDLIELKPRAESPPKGIQRENDEDQEVYFDTKDDNYVVVESNSDKDTKSIPEDTARSETGDDSDNNESVPIGSLFDSVDTLPRVEGEEISSSTRLNKSTYLITDGTTLICELNLDVYQKYFANTEFQNLANVKTIPNAQLEKNKKIFEKQQNSTVSLYDCLKNFGTPEILGDHDLWYCPRCKDHKKATKTISIWSIGDVLAIHLKRFQSVRSFSDKVNIVVDFPIEGLDMSGYVSNKCNKDAVYDLIAVDNHFGGLGGGHYTSCAKNYRNNEWYYFNDSRVTKMDDSKECVSGAAYLLFYRRRTADGQLGGERLSSMIKEGREHLVTEFENLRASLQKTKDQVKDFSEHHEGESCAQGKDTTDNPVFSFQSLQKIGSDSPNTASLKKSRSNNNDDIPLDQDKENVDQNHRKQRLISKDKLFNKSISIKSQDVLPSTADVASPLSVSSEDNTQNDNVSMLNSENNNDT